MLSMRSKGGKREVKEGGDVNTLYRMDVLPVLMQAKSISTSDGPLIRYEVQQFHSAEATPVNGNLRRLLINVPATGSCVFYSAVMAYLLPVMHDEALFRARFNKLFGTEQVLAKAEDVLPLLRLYDGSARYIRENDDPTLNGPLVILAQLASKVLRPRVVHYMMQRKDYVHDILEPILQAEENPESLDDYEATMATTHRWAGEPEFQNLCDMLDINMVVLEETVVSRTRDKSWAHVRDYYCEGRKAEDTLFLVQVWERTHYNYLVDPAVFGEAGMSLYQSTWEQPEFSDEEDDELERQNEEEEQEEELVRGEGVDLPESPSVSLLKQPAPHPSVPSSHHAQTQIPAPTPILIQPSPSPHPFVRLSKTPSPSASRQTSPLASPKLVNTSSHLPSGSGTSSPVLASPGTKESEQLGLVETTTLYQAYLQQYYRQQVIKAVMTTVTVMFAILLTPITLAIFLPLRNFIIKRNKKVELVRATDEELGASRDFGLSWQRMHQTFMQQHQAEIPTLDPKPVLAPALAKKTTTVTARRPYLMTAQDAAMFKLFNSSVNVAPDDLLRNRQKAEKTRHAIVARAG